MLGMPRTAIAKLILTLIEVIPSHHSTSATAPAVVDDFRFGMPQNKVDANHVLH